MNSAESQSSSDKTERYFDVFVRTMAWLIVGMLAGFVIGAFAYGVTFGVLTPFVLNSVGAEQVEWEIRQERCAAIAFFVFHALTIVASLVPHRSIRKYVLCTAFLSIVFFIALFARIALRYLLHAWSN